MVAQNIFQKPKKAASYIFTVATYCGEKPHASEYFIEKWLLLFSVWTET